MSVPLRDSFGWTVATWLGIARDPGPLDEVIDDLRAHHPRVWRRFLLGFEHLETAGVIRMTERDEDES